MDQQQARLDITFELLAIESEIDLHALPPYLVKR
jgi:hypothetical protein